MISSSASQKDYRLVRMMLIIAQTHSWDLGADNEAVTWPASVQIWPWNQSISLYC